MNDLSNTIAHILEHERHLVNANEATIQQYVVLPILRALGWDDANLATMEVLPQYVVKGAKNGIVDYALQVAEKIALLIECKKWNDPLEKHESQITDYAFKAGAPIAILTSGKVWCFYFSWVEGIPVNKRIFCDINIEDRENAISNLEKYLLKSNVVSGQSKLYAQIALKEKEKTDASKSVPIPAETSTVNEAINPKPMRLEVTIAGKLTVERIRNSLSQELRSYYEKMYPEERLKLFYEGVAGVQNLIIKEEWRLNSSKFSKMLCGFMLTDKGAIGNIKRIFGIHPDVGFPLAEVVGRDGKLIKKTRASVPPRLFVRITEEEAKQLEREHSRCEFCGFHEGKSVDYVYYNIPKDMSVLLPVLEFAYKKHSGN